jgi:hypothetical protein
MRLQCAKRRIHLHLSSLSCQILHVFASIAICEHSVSLTCSTPLSSLPFYFSSSPSSPRVLTSFSVTLGDTQRRLQQLYVCSRHRRQQLYNGDTRRAIPLCQRVPLQRRCRLSRHRLAAAAQFFNLSSLSFCIVMHSLHLPPRAFLPPRYSRYPFEHARLRSSLGPPFYLPEFQSALPSFISILQRDLLHRHRRRTTCHPRPCPLSP